jgi:hypothetical protein
MGVKGGGLFGNIAWWGLPTILCLRLESAGPAPFSSMSLLSGFASHSFLDLRKRAPDRHFPEPRTASVHGASVKTEDPCESTGLPARGDRSAAPPSRPSSLPTTTRLPKSTRNPVRDFVHAKPTDEAPHIRLEARLTARPVTGRGGRRGQSVQPVGAERRAGLWLLIEAL